jgi:NitT/TauT family transport system permease protein
MSTTAMRGTVAATGTGSWVKPLVRRMARWLQGVLQRSWGVIAIVAAWQLWATLSGFNRIVLPTPLEVASDLVHHPGIYAGDTLRTLTMGLLGLAAGMIIGFLLGLVVWLSPVLAGLFGPAALIVRSIPIITIIPVLSQVIGYGNQVVPLVTTLLSFFPAFVMTGAGIREATPSSLDMIVAFGGTRRSALRYILVPGAIPSLLVALRLSAATCVLGALVAEFLAGTEGLGDLFADARIRFEMERAWGAALIATVLSVALFLLASRLERWGSDRYRSS